jgi:hypothetical protein
MFEGFKLKQAKKSMTKYIDKMAYRKAFELMLEKVVYFGQDRAPLIEMHESSVTHLLMSCGMPENFAKRYQAEYEFAKATSPNGECSAQTQLEKHKAFMQAKKDCGEIDEYKMVRENLLFERAQYGFRSDKSIEFDIKLKTNELNHLKSIMPDSTEEELETAEFNLRKEIIELRYKKGEIGFLDYEKSIHSLEGKKWFNYQIKIDESEDRPEVFELQVDFNDEFVNWLVDFGITLDGTEHEGVDPDSEEYAELLVEKWAKGALMSLAATMLVDDGGDTFRSVVASEPEGTIVQRLEIDRDNLEEYYGDDLTPEQIQDIANKTRNRRMYK